MRDYDGENQILTINLEDLLVSKRKLGVYSYGWVSGT
jgi:hypothetical protein